MSNDNDGITKVQVKASGVVYAKSGTNTRLPYPHQLDAMENLDKIDDKFPSYSTLVVLPTGGGKTYTATIWLLKRAINRGKKILWIAHRKELLDQAAETFQAHAYADYLTKVASFRYRIVSGDREHDRTRTICKTDNVLFASKDSIGKNLDALKKWFGSEEELYLVIDEAHHATAKTYRTIIDLVKKRIKRSKIIGLTATPFRTAESEQGLLSKIFTDGVCDNKPVAGHCGMAYKIGLKELIGQGILSTPDFESCNTNAEFGVLGGAELDRIQRFDILPENIAKELSDNKERNRLIVDTYTKNVKKYGQTIVFALNVNHAIALSSLFCKAGVKAKFVVSDIRDMTSGVKISSEENQRNLDSYRNGKTQVLVNVNKLTEGLDLPKTQTVFLARPTVSTILMTQMIGRALRGERAGGTSKAHIVSFIDNWKSRIAWVSPESLNIDNNEFSEDRYDRQKRILRLISIAKIEEFAAMLDSTVDTSALERIPFEKRYPIGMYKFSYLDVDGMERGCCVLVYDSTEKAYKRFMKSLPELFKEFRVSSEYLPDEKLKLMVRQVRDTFFIGEMIPPYDERDVEDLLKYYAQNEATPIMTKIDLKIDISSIAKHIVDEDMGPKKKHEYVNSLWESKDGNLRDFFGRKQVFENQLDIEIKRLIDPAVFKSESNVKYDYRELKDMTLHEIGKYNPRREQQLRDKAFSAARLGDGTYVCAKCRKQFKSRINLQVDHIIPLNKGGQSVPENLQVLCRRCNGKKGDRIL